MSKPINYEKYKNKNNILLLTDEENTYIIKFNDCNNLVRNGDNSYKNGIIEIKLLGILNYGKNIN